MAKFLARLPRSRVEKTRSREPSQPALSYERIEHLTKDLEVKGRSRKPGQPVTATAKATRMNKKVIGLITKTTVVYYLHGQTGQSTVWVNGKQNSGLVNVVPESQLPFVQISSISREPIAKGGL